MCIQHILLIHSPVNGYLGFSQLLAIVINDTMNMVLQISLEVLIFNSSGYIPSNKISGTCDNSGFKLFKELLYYFP